MCYIDKNISISQMKQWFKRQVKKLIKKQVKDQIHDRFPDKVWSFINW